MQVLISSYFLLLYLRQLKKDRPTPPSQGSGYPGWEAPIMKDERKAGGKKTEKKTPINPYPAM